MEHGGTSKLYLFAGLDNGTYLRTTVDKITGVLSDTSSKQLGTRAVKMSTVTIGGRQGICATSDRTWLFYIDQGRFNISPLSYDTIDCTAFFKNDRIEGLVIICGTWFKILLLESFGKVFNERVFPCQATPKKFVRNPDSNSLLMI
ncbi:MAG: hypothetical protein V2I33_24150 [Kangiellaceae bacterium]|jgi:splicing factor 3B subunit 3|nr:hypothetical protein [Kangiellaceae bacterium]